ncbi:MAG: DNA-deoxyinosine glycosylase [Ruthenibacterium sp.]
MSFEPICSPTAQILIVGTWPSPKSREEGFYYGHPQNRFWPLLARLLNAPVPETIVEKTALITEHNLALWDTLESCTITGAADVSIKDAVPNDIAALCKQFPIRKVLCNGSKAYSLYNEYIVDAPPAVKVPSTSPANAAWDIDRLAAAWGEALQ